VLLLIEVLRGAVNEVSMVRTQTLDAELQQLQSRALQRAKGLEVLVESHDAAGSPWTRNRDESWFTAYWSDQRPGEHDLYSAVVDEAGQIVAHTESSRVGRRLGSSWYEEKISEVGPDVVSTQRSVLGGDRKAYDVTVPLQVKETPIGEYHEGLDPRWLEARIAGRQRRAATHWLWVIALVGSVDAVAVWALVALARGQSRGWRALRGQTRQRSRELSQIGSGLAHEIRNPLHALRINLHTLLRSFSSRNPLPEDQLIATIVESESAIDRLDQLMRDLVQFTDRSAGKASDVDLAHEVRATLGLLGDTLQHERIEVSSRFPSEPSPIAIDPVRLRQLVLNVLTMAQHRAGKSGKIDVLVDRVNGGVELAVGDSGPTLPDDQRSRIFEPFQAPAETGSGLGLALVQVYVEEAGGRAIWDNGAAAGRCRLWFPLAPSAPKGGHL
jgi:signal transduction histidine kinase